MWSETVLKDLEFLCDNMSFDTFHHKTILITGANGLIGRSLLNVLVYLNEENLSHMNIIGTVRDISKAKEVMGEIAEKITLVSWDITEELQVNETVDYVIHTASPTDSQYFVDHPVETIHQSYLGTRNILEFAKNAQCQSVVYLSSMEVYGVTDESLEEIREKDLGYIDILNVRSSYSEGKRMCECLCASYMKQYQVPVKIARLAQTFGPGVLKTDNRIYAQFMRSVKEKTDIVLKTRGQSVLNYCYTYDAVRAIFTILLHGRVGEAYTVTNPKNTMKVCEMAEMVCRNFGNEQMHVLFEQDDNTPYRPDTTMRLCDEKLKGLGFQAHYSLEDMYRNTLKEELKSDKSF